MSLKITELPSYLYTYPASFEDRFTSDWKEIPTYLQDFFKTNDGLLYNFAQQYALVAAGVLIVGVLALLIGMWRRDNAAKGNKMGKKWQREQHIKTVFGDILTDLVEEARYRDLLTRNEKKMLYQRLAKAFEIEDLLASPIAARKAKIRNNMRNNGKIKPNIPGDPPPPLVRNETTKPKFKPKSLIGQRLLGTS